MSQSASVIKSSEPAAGSETHSRKIQTASWLLPAAGGWPVAERQLGSLQWQSMSNEDPIGLFLELFERARQQCVDDPTAMVLATADRYGRPSVRFVLLKGVDERGFVFYTNLGSRKAREIEANPQAALCFYWPPLEKQVRVEGPVERVSEREADAYFASRPREFQLSAWASKQSDALASRAALDARVREMHQRFEGRVVPRPPFWSGLRLVPERIEFWTRHPERLHERVLFERRDGRWVTSFLFP